MRETAASYVELDRTTFAGAYGRRPFVFRHRLAGHPLFAMPRLTELAELMTRVPGGVVYNSAKVEIGQRWDRTPVPARDVLATLRDIETSDGWVVLKRAEEDPAYRAILETCLEEMQTAYGRDLSDQVKKRNAIVFINSPHRITNYHIDREWNCLLQIAGTKRVSVFDRTDREVLPEEEIERFWTVDNNAAVWKPQYAERALVFDLRPGDALHIPVNAPHWVRNGPDVSVSLSVNFHLRDALLGDVYRTNYWLRRIGLRPRPPGRSPVADATKRAVYGSARAVRDFVRRARS